MPLDHFIATFLMDPGAASMSILDVVFGNVLTRNMRKKRSGFEHVLRAASVFKASFRMPTGAMLLRANASTGFGVGV